MADAQEWNDFINSAIDERRDDINSINRLVSFLLFIVRLTRLVTHTMFYRSTKTQSLPTRNFKPTTTSYLSLRSSGSKSLSASAASRLLSLPNSAQVAVLSSSTQSTMLFRVSAMLVATISSPAPVSPASSALLMRSKSPGNLDEYVLWARPLKREVVASCP